MNTALDFTQLDALLALPCRLIDDCPVLTGSIINFDRNTCGETFEGTVLPGESLQQFLNRVHKGKQTYPMECSLYVQLAALVIEHKWPIHGGDIKLYFSDAVNDQKIFDLNSSLIGYIGIDNLEVTRRFDPLPIFFKGRWVIRVDNDKFLTLRHDGPVITNMTECIEQLYHKILNYEDTSFYGDVVKTWIKQFNDQGKLNSWGFFTDRNYCPITAVITPEGICLGYNDPEHKNMEMRSRCAQRARHHLINMLSPEPINMDFENQDEWFEF